MPRRGPSCGRVVCALCLPHNGRSRVDLPRAEGERDSGAGGVAQPGDLQKWLAKRPGRTPCGAAVAEGRVASGVSLSTNAGRGDHGGGRAEIVPHPAAKGGVPLLRKVLRHQRHRAGPPGVVSSIALLSGIAEPQHHRMRHVCTRPTCAAQRRAVLLAITAAAKGHPARDAGLPGEAAVVVAAAAMAQSSVAQWPWRGWAQPSLHGWLVAIERIWAAGAIPEMRHAVPRRGAGEAV